MKILFSAFCTLFLLLSFSVSAKEVYTPIQAQIPVYCEEISGEETATYTIKMENPDSRAPKPDKDSITVKGAQTAFFVLNVTEPGTFVYKVYQGKGSDKNIQYDEKVYDVYLCVLNDDNNNLIYTISVTLSGTSEKPEKIEFTNKKTIEPPSDNPPSDKPAEDNPPKKVNPPSGHVDGRSSKTGENNGYLIGIYGGVMVLLAIGAVVYVLIKRKRSAKETTE